ncbi:MAG: TrbI/VirB10 family protein [Oligoflexia bacterium]|nr:TrbI/VirB10 family protein [Oligoflexia bacterium]
MIALIITVFINPTEDRSFLRKSFQPIKASTLNSSEQGSNQEVEMKLPIRRLSEKEVREETEMGDVNNSNKVDTKIKSTQRSKQKTKSPSQRPQNEETAVREESEINYSAPIVIYRDDKNDPNAPKIPIGSSFMGKLLTPIDTRIANTLVRIELPYGAKNKGAIIIPKGTVLFAQVQYPDDSERVYLTISRGVTKDDTEFDIKAEALSSEDFNPGIVGEYHSNLPERLASNFGWSMSGAAAEVLQERQVIGTTDGAVVLPKSTVQNALLEGTKRTINNESGRAIEGLNRRKAYVTIPSGKHLIITLTQTFMANNLEQGGIY